MLPKPPFACDLSSEDELAIFDNLKPRLDGVWDALTDCDERTYTSVVIPSMTLDQRELQQAGRCAVLRGAAAAPLDPAAESPRAHGVRHLTTRAPDDPRVLPESPDRRPREPRQGASDDAVRRTTRRRDR